jgi:hypothetical protein
MREIERTSAAALRHADAKEFSIQLTYANLVMTRMAQIPDAPNGRDIDCMLASTSLYQLLSDVSRAFSPARAEADYDFNSRQWRKAITSCERAVGLKPASRLL